MVAIFCLRLALGMILPLAVLSSALVHPRFFRVQYLTSLTLLAVAGFFLFDQADATCKTFLGFGMLLCVVGSIAWHVEGYPLRKTIFCLTLAALIGCTVYGGMATRGNHLDELATIDDFVSAGLLGAATSAMLMGHSYLLAPSMSIVPLKRLIALLTLALFLRLAFASYGLWRWTQTPGGVTLEEETLLWLGARWTVGFVTPIALTWMAWETARIRSTQSATGILYVVVILCFLGELTSQLLLAKLHVIV